MTKSSKLWHPNVYHCLSTIRLSLISLVLVFIPGNAGNKWQGNPRVGVLVTVCFFGGRKRFTDLYGQIAHFSILSPFGISIPDEGCVCLVLSLDRCLSSGPILSYDNYDMDHLDAAGLVRVFSQPLRRRAKNGEVRVLQIWDHIGKIGLWWNVVKQRERERMRKAQAFKLFPRQVVARAWRHETAWDNDFDVNGLDLNFPTVLWLTTCGGERTGETLMRRFRDACRLARLANGIQWPSHCHPWCVGRPWGFTWNMRRMPCLIMFAMFLGVWIF